MPAHLPCVTHTAPAPAEHSRVAARTAASSCPKYGADPHENLQQGQNLFLLPKAGSRNVWDTSLYIYLHLKLCSSCLYPENTSKRHTHSSVRTLKNRHCFLSLHKEIDTTALLAAFERNAQGLIPTAYKPQSLIQHVYAWVIIFPVFQTNTLQEYPFSRKHYTKVLYLNPEL